VHSHANVLPPAFVASSAAFLSSDGSGVQGSLSALGLLNQRVFLAPSTTANQTPCPLPFTLSNGSSFCNGFNAVDMAGGTAVVDTYDFSSGLGGCTIPVAGGNFANGIYGIWRDNPTSTSDTYVLAAASCGDLGLGASYSGLNVPTGTTDIANLNAAFAAGTQVTVSGVVTAAWGGKSSYGLYLQDPQGGAGSGAYVYKSSSSTAGGTAPQIGDYVTVSGTTSGTTLSNREIDL
jgi:hypothetical protein